jgi:hypothetical protein
MPELGNDALSLEYELMYGCASGELDIADVVNDALLLREGRIFRLSLSEQLLDCLDVELRTVADDRGDPLLISPKRT